MDKKLATKLTNLGRNPAENAGAVNTGIIRTSTIIFPTVADLEASERDEYRHGSYGRHGTPTVHALSDTIREIEGADHTLLTSSGVSAITTALMSAVKTGDHLLVADCVYGPTRAFCDFELKRLGVETTYFDPAIGTGIAELIRPNTRVVFLEAPGSLTFEMQDIPAIAEIAHKHNIIVMGDNTWATPLYMKPFELGMDVSIHSATKYISGHSDLLMGVMSTTKAYYPTLLNTHKRMGACTNPEDCYLALRGIRTILPRLEIQQKSALEIAEWFLSRKEVAEVRHPALPGSLGHEIWKRDFTGGAALFAVTLKPEYSKAKVDDLLNGLELFAMGYSWGGYESLILPIKLGGLRSASAWPHKGITLRIHIGLEDVNDLKADLAAGLNRLA